MTSLTPPSAGQPKPFVGTHALLWLPMPDGAHLLYVLGDYQLTFDSPRVDVTNFTSRDPHFVHGLFSGIDLKAKPGSFPAAQLTDEQRLAMAVLEGHNDAALALADEVQMHRDPSEKFRRRWELEAELGRLRAEQDDRLREQARRLDMLRYALMQVRDCRHLRPAIHIARSALEELGELELGAPGRHLDTEDAEDLAPVLIPHPSGDRVTWDIDPAHRHEFALGDLVRLHKGRYVVTQDPSEADGRVLQVMAEGHITVQLFSSVNPR